MFQSPHPPLLSIRRYLRMARFVGDNSYLPFLEKVARDLEEVKGVGEQRMLKYAREAISVLAEKE